MKANHCLLIGFFLFLSGCDTETATNAEQASEAATLPADAPALGTKIQQLTGSGAKTTSQTGEYPQIAWEDLELPGHGLEDIVKKYQPQIDAIPEGDPAEEAVMDKMQAELNTAPVNPAMNGKKIKLPGFVAPLEIDESNGMVGDFLLVPYFGACIHLPPPPLSQTLLVKPKTGKSIGMERVYEPVWVSGTIKTESTKTDLADAGYKIVDAAIEMYQEPNDETQ
ncbi:DUF3299 domain-containing protein [Thiothrix subterranea]|uniref:DUF3299 domain-containing protein n=1 Tax=Thiothrix subterranea TaxID=2735563 RepID=UPI00192C75E5|nr:DUF3299 domain-containing protein [Thiothrix subterranea]QQZ27637.1 DUF3299 domain-containing protein [Thiothrix subterranea]